MIWQELWSDYTFRVVVSGSAMIGAISGALGCFAYLRRQSMVGDVVSHASLLGITGSFWLAYLITGVGSKSLWLLIPGAIVIGVVALLLTKAITSVTRIKEDAGLGVMLAIFFGTGLMLLRWMQRANPPVPGHSGLEGYLFGMAATMTMNDLWMIGGLGVISILLMLLFWPGLKVLTFDPKYAAGLGLPVRGLELLMLSLMVTGIVIGLQIAGVVLMVAMLVAPASAARQWTQGLGHMVLLAAGIGGISAALGAAISATGDHVPTGPAIVVILSSVFLVSILLAPGRGLLYRRRRHVA